MASDAPSDNTTLSSVLRGYEADGYIAQFVVQDDGQVHCCVCGHTSHPAELQMPSLRRLEGASDPADMSAVLAVACPHCGARGTVVVLYGPQAPEGDVAVLEAIEDVRSDDAPLPAAHPTEEPEIPSDRGAS